MLLFVLGTIVVQHALCCVIACCANSTVHVCLQHESARTEEEFNAGVEYLRRKCVQHSCVETVRLSVCSALVLCSADSLPRVVPLLLSLQLFKWAQRELFGEKERKRWALYSRLAWYGPERGIASTNGIEGTVLSCSPDCWLTVCRRAGVNLGLIAGALGDIKKIRRLDQLVFAIKDMLTLLDNVQAMKEAGRHAKRKVLRGRSLLPIAFG
jgi:hypothetical protein